TPRSSLPSEDRGVFLRLHALTRRELASSRTRTSRQRRPSALARRHPLRPRSSASPPSRPTPPLSPRQRSRRRPPDLIRRAPRLPFARALPLLHPDFRYSSRLLQTQPSPLFKQCIVSITAKIRCILPKRLRHSITSQMGGSP